MLRNIFILLLFPLLFSCGRKNIMPKEYLTSQQVQRVTEGTTSSHSLEDKPSEEITKQEHIFPSKEESKGEKQNTTIVKKLPPKVDSKTQTEKVSTTAKNNPQSVSPISNSTANAIPEAPHGYHIIVGSFPLSQIAQANKLYYKLKAKQYDAYLIKSKERIRISIKHCKNAEDAAKERDKYRKLINREDLWIMKY